MNGKRYLKKQKLDTYIYIYIYLGWIEHFSNKYIVCGELKENV